MGKNKKKMPEKTYFQHLLPEEKEEKFQEKDHESNADIGFLPGDDLSGWFDRRTLEEEEIRRR